MAARVVVDSNRLRSGELASFLERSPKHFAVITDYAWMEAYKDNPLVTLPKSMAILKYHPKQVILLKGTKDICALDPSAAGIALAMQYKNSASEFGKMLIGLEAAEAGNKNVILQIRAHSVAAGRHMANLLSDMNGMTSALAAVASTIYADAEIDIIRSGAKYPFELLEKFVTTSDYIAERFYLAHPLKPRRLRPSARINAFTYRYALATQLFLFSWIRGGNQMNKAHAKLRNDLVDMNFATYATYFNGLMSADKRVVELHAELRAVVKLLGGRVPDEQINDQSLVS